MDRTTHIPSGVASLITTNHAAKVSVFVDLRNAGNLKNWPTAVPDARGHLRLVVRSHVQRPPPAGRGFTPQRHQLKTRNPKPEIQNPRPETRTRNPKPKSPTGVLKPCTTASSSRARFCPSTFRVSGFGFRFLGLGVRASDFGFQVSGFGFRILV